jgi:hypothetical protein
VTIFLIAAISVLIIALMLLLRSIARQRRKYTNLRAMYTNGDGGGLGEHASIQEWKRLANASMEASRTRRKNGAL